MTCYSSNIFSNNAKTGHCNTSIQHRHKIICILMCTSLKLFCFSSIQSFMMVYSLSFKSLNFVLKLNSLFLLFILLLMRPVKNSLRFLFVKSKFLLIQMIIFVNLSVFHLELRNIISGFVFVCFKIKLNYGTVTNR